MKAIPNYPICLVFKLVMNIFNILKNDYLGIKEVKLATIVTSDPKALFSIAYYTNV